MALTKLRVGYLSIDQYGWIKFYFGKKYEDAWCPQQFSNYSPNPTYYAYQYTSVSAHELRPPKETHQIEVTEIETKETSILMTSRTETD